MSKGYTINYYIKQVSSLSNKEMSNLENFFNALSPRNGKNSVKAESLINFLGGKDTVASLIEGSNGFGNYGKSSKTRILKALQKRKKMGPIFV